MSQFSQPHHQRTKHGLNPGFSPVSASMTVPYASQEVPVSMKPAGQPGLAAVQGFVIPPKMERELQSMNVSRAPVSKAGYEYRVHDVNLALSFPIDKSGSGIVHLSGVKESIRKMLAHQGVFVDEEDMGRIVMESVKATGVTLQNPVAVGISLKLKGQCHRDDVDGAPKMPNEVAANCEYEVPEFLIRQLKVVGQDGGIYHAVFNGSEGPQGVTLVERPVDTSLLVRMATGKLKVALDEVGTISSSSPGVLLTDPSYSGMCYMAPHGTTLRDLVDGATQKFNKKYSVGTMAKSPDTLLVPVTTAQMLLELQEERRKQVVGEFDLGNMVLEAKRIHGGETSREVLLNINLALKFHALTKPRADAQPAQPAK